MDAGEHPLAAVGLSPPPLINERRGLSQGMPQGVLFAARRLL